jgi:hypothetical protein
MPTTSYEPEDFPSYCGGAMYVLNRYVRTPGIYIVRRYLYYTYDHICSLIVLLQ